MVQSRQKAENETENKDNNVGSLLDIDTCIDLRTPCSKIHCSPPEDQHLGLVFWCRRLLNLLSNNTTKPF